MKNKNFNYYISKRYDCMMGRCYRKSEKSYKNYGGRGIRVCSDWIKDIESFRDWFNSELKKNKLTQKSFIENSRKWALDRIDNDGHYTPKNCRLVSVQKNARNRPGFKIRKIVSAEGEKISL